MGTRVGEEEIDVGGLMQAAMHGRLRRGRWEAVARGEVGPVPGGGRDEHSTGAYVHLENSLSASLLRRKKESKVWEVR